MVVVFPVYQAQWTKRRPNGRVLKLQHIAAPFPPYQQQYSPMHHMWSKSLRHTFGRLPLDRPINNNIAYDVQSLQYQRSYGYANSTSPWLLKKQSKQSNPFFHQNNIHNIYTEWKLTKLYVDKALLFIMVATAKDDAYSGVCIMMRYCALTTLTSRDRTDLCVKRRIRKTKKKLAIGITNDPLKYTARKHISNTWRDTHNKMTPKRINIKT